MIIATTPKSFEGPEHIADIQHRAIKSWIRYKSRDRDLIALLGHDPGVFEACLRHQLIHSPNVECHESGIPIMSSVFERAQTIAGPNGIVLYVNCDIILLPKVFDAIRIVSSQYDEFMLSGQRWNWTKPRDLLDYSVVIGDQDEGWMDPDVCIDWFAFPAGMITDMPPFVMGNYAWDSWLLSHAYIELKVPTIDASEFVTVIHQDHAQFRHDRGSELANRNRAMITREDIRTGGFLGKVPYKMTVDGTIERR